MAHLDVLDLRPADPHHAALYRGHIEYPKVGQRVDAHAVRVGGWVFGHVQPAVAVELLAGSDVIGRAPAWIMRWIERSWASSEVSPQASAIT